MIRAVRAARLPRGGEVRRDRLVDLSDDEAFRSYSAASFRMPFTIAHAAAAIPIRWLSARRLPLAALVVGTMAPDFEYPFRLAAVGRLGHSVSGIFTFCLPVGLAVLVFYQVRLWPWVTFLAPDSHRQRLTTVDLLRVNSVAVLLSSAAAIIVGAVSHVAWDSFTHRNGWVVKQVPTLQEHFVSVAGLDIHIYQLVQHGSTAIGLAVLTGAYVTWYRRMGPAPSIIESDQVRFIRARIVGVLAFVPVVGGLTLAAWSVQSLSGGRLIAGAVVQFAVGWITTLAICLVVLGMFRPPAHQVSRLIKND